MSATVLGRAWIFDTGDPPQVEVWEHEFEPTDGGRRSGADWCREYLDCSVAADDLRELLEVPKEGNWQVLFKGKMDGCRTGSLDGDDWDDWFDLEESKCEPIPAEHMEFFREAEKDQRQRADAAASHRETADMARRLIMAHDQMTVLLGPILGGGDVMTDSTKVCRAYLELLEKQR